MINIYHMEKKSAAKEKKRSPADLIHTLSLHAIAVTFAVVFVVVAVTVTVADSCCCYCC